MRKGVRQVLDKLASSSYLKLNSKHNRSSSGGAGRARTYDDRIMSR